MKLLIRIFLILFGTTIGLFLTEYLLFLLRFEQGTRPVPYRPDQFAFIPPYREHDLAGWQLKPGNYKLILGGKNTPTTVTIWPDGSRATSDKGDLKTADPRNIFFFGDSYFFGEGLSDEETIPWQVQSILPDRMVKNFGVGGYGTCQAMLRLEEQKERVTAGDFVLYGLSSFHEERNTADPRQDFWSALASPKHSSSYPRCGLRDGEIIREQSKRWEPVVPLTGVSRISKLLTDAWLNILAVRSIGYQRELTLELLARMKRISDDREATFIILIQDVPPSYLDAYSDFFNRNKIIFIDGSAIAQRKELSLPDGHPGPKMARLWAHQIAERLSQF